MADVVVEDLPALLQAEEKRTLSSLLHHIYIDSKTRVRKRCHNIMGPHFSVTTMRQNVKFFCVPMASSNIAKLVCPKQTFSKTKGIHAKFRRSFVGFPRHLKRRGATTQYLRARSSIIIAAQLEFPPVESFAAHYYLPPTDRDRPTECARAGPWTEERH